MLICMFSRFCLIGLLTLAFYAYPFNQEMYDIIYSFPEQLQEGFEIGTKQAGNHKPYFRHKNIVACGMGGSAITADILGVIGKHDFNVPYLVVKNYTLPSWVDANTLVILFSYSGNTEETLSCFELAYQSGARILGVTSGGPLGSLLQERGLDSITIPGGLPPRAALGYLLGSVLGSLSSTGLIADQSVAINRSVEQLSMDRIAYGKDDDTNSAYVLAQEMHTSFPIIYGESETTSAIAYRWCCQLAENSKMIAHPHVLPELNHNEIVGWQKAGKDETKNGVIWLLDQSMLERNMKRYELTKDIIKEQTVYQYTAMGQGETVLERMLSLIYLGDWVSFWCAVLNDVDPMPIDNIDTLKEEMGFSPSPKATA